MTKEGYAILNSIGTYSTLLPISIGLLKWRSLNKLIKAIVLLSIMSFVAEQGTFLLRRQHINSNVLLQIYTIAATGILFFFYFRIIRRPSLKKPLILTFVVYSIISIYGWFFSTNSNLNGIFLAVHSILILVLGLIYFSGLFTGTEPEPILRNPIFWINSGLVIRFAGVLILFISMDYLINVLKVDMFLYWSVNDILNSVLQLLISYGIFLSSRKKELEFDK